MQRMTSFHNTAQPKTAKDIAMRAIIHLVISHKYAPGDRLLETSLSEDLNMSRTPVREALTALETMGFLERVKSHKGYQIPFLSADDVQKVFHTRAILESDTAYSATRHISDRDVEYLRNLNQVEKTAYNNKDRALYSSSNEEFHMLLASRADNAYIVRYTRELYWRSSLYYFFFTSFYAVTTSPSQTQRMANSEHFAIIDALKDRDAENAAKLMREHIMSTYYSMVAPKTSLATPDSAVN